MIFVNVIPDQYVEGDEFVGIQLQPLVGPGSVFTFDGMESQADLYIVDNDSWQWDEKPDDTVVFGPKELDPWFGDAGLMDSQFSSRGHYFFGEPEPDEIGVSVFLYSDWDWYYWGWTGVEGQHDFLHRTLGLYFTFDALTGVIRPVDGSGVDGVAELNSAFNEIAYNYTIDNSGVYSKTATVNWTALSAVKATITRSNSGGVNGSGKVAADGTEVGLSGSWNVGYTLQGSDGGDGINVAKTSTFTLRSTEPAGS